MYNCIYFVYYLHLQPSPCKGPSKTIFNVIGRVWPCDNSKLFITVQRSYWPESQKIAVVSASNMQRWAIVFDSCLQRRNQFIIVSYPVPEYIVRVVSTGRYSYSLDLERIPHWWYVNGAPFHNPGRSYIFTTEDCYNAIDYRFKGEYIQHVETGHVLTLESSNLSLRPLQRNCKACSQCWRHRGL